MNLNPKQIKFVDEYLVDLNATQAAIRAGYASGSAKVQGSRLLSNANIQELITERRKKMSEETGITAKRVLEEYARVAFLDPREAYTVDSAIQDIHLMDEDTSRAIASLEVNEMTDNATGLKIGQVSKVRFHNKLTALEALGKHLGLFEKDNEQSAPKAQAIVNLGSGVDPADDD